MNPADDTYRADEPPVGAVGDERVNPHNTHGRRAAQSGVVPPRRVLVHAEQAFTSPWAVRAALTAAWGDGRGVLVTGSRRTGAERMAERLWRSWGGRVEAHPRGWGLHQHRPDHPARPATGHAAGADIHLTVGRHARAVAHEATGAAVERARRAVQQLALHTDTDTVSDTARPDEDQAQDAEGLA
jgi:hypothetical protein